MRPTGPTGNSCSLPGGRGESAPEVHYASRHLFLQYAFDIAALQVTELPFSRADVFVYLIR